MYDFETAVNRAGTGSSKWEQMKEWKPDVKEGTVPFSVADMELKNPPEITNGLKEYLDTAVLGYTVPTKEYFDSVCGWMKKRHGWEVKPEWIVNSPGVVGAFYSAIRALTDPGDGVIVMTPVYYPFYSAIERNNRKVVKNPLINTGAAYSVDFDDLERKARDPRNKILLFCSPHNPVGRVWRREELERIGEICLRHSVLIISDEIHFDIIMPGHRHTVFASLSEELADNMIVCTAPSKTFNLAGMQTSNIVIQNREIRDAYIREVESQGFFTLNIMGFKACEIAYSRCEAWLEEFINLVNRNHLELRRYIEENIPAIRVYPMEGTYLQWMDFSGLGLDRDRLEKLMHEAELFFDEGYIFGDEGNCYERMNIACPTSVMMKALERLKDTVNK